MYSDDFWPVSPGNDPVYSTSAPKTLQGATPCADPDCAASCQSADPVSDDGAGVCSPCADPGFPIFWPTYTPLLDGYQQDWWWFDRGLSPADHGPFNSQSEAVADWGVSKFTAGVAADAAAIDATFANLPPCRASRQLWHSESAEQAQSRHDPALCNDGHCRLCQASGLPYPADELEPPTAAPDPAYLLQQLDRIQVDIYEPKTQTGRALLALMLEEAELKQAHDEGVALLARLSYASPANRALLADLLTGEKQAGGLVLGVNHA